MLYFLPVWWVCQAPRGSEITLGGGGGGGGGVREVISSEHMKTQKNTVSLINRQQTYPRRAYACLQSQVQKRLGRQGKCEKRNQSQPGVDKIQHKDKMTHLENEKAYCF